MITEELKEGERYAVKIKGKTQATTYHSTLETVNKKVREIESKGKMCVVSILKSPDIFNPFVFADKPRQIYSTSLQGGAE